MKKQVSVIHFKATIICLILFYPPKRKKGILAYGDSGMQNHKVLYMNLFTSGKLNSHLADVDEQAQEMFSRLVNQMAEREGVTEQLKLENQMKWVARMNNIQSRTAEIVNHDIIYN